MPQFDLIKEPNPLLHQISVPVEKFDEELKSFMYSLLETMDRENGMGIAAAQVGKLIRALIVDISKKHENEIEARQPFFIINPEIIKFSDEKIILNEGCLSIRKEDGI